jgi:hypothetical protein
VDGIRSLVRLYEQLEFDGVMRFGLRQLASAPRLFLGAIPFLDERPGRLGGLFNTEPLERLVFGKLDWSGISRNIRNGVIDALALRQSEVVLASFWAWWR